MCNEKIFYSIFKSDRFGFNNNDNIWEQDEIEYVLFGDSYVMGSCVDSEYNISSNLENFSKKEILNLGYAGAGPLIYLATMREYLPEVKINKIIFFWFEYNDPKDLSKELKNSILVKYLENSNFSQNLKSKQHKIDLMLNDIINQEYKKMKPKLIKKISYTNFIFFNQIYKKIFILKEFKI